MECENLWSRIELARCGGEYLRSIHPYGDWIFVGILLIVIIPLVVISVGGKR